MSYYMNTKANERGYWREIEKRHPKEKDNTFWMALVFILAGVGVTNIWMFLF